MIKATYITHMGSDNLVVDAARASFEKISGNYSDEQNSRLIKFLAKNGHWTPFSHPQITLLHEVPIFLARQEFKHVVGFTRNERSGRYVSSEPKCYMPDVWRMKPEGSIKQGSAGVHRNSEMWTDVIAETYRSLMKTYNAMIKDGVAAEQARMILPQAMMTSYYVTGSLAAFARSYKLRIAEDSQKEIQMLAKQWDEIIRPLYPTAWAALNE